MNPSSNRNTRGDNIATLNAILQKSSGDFQNLDYDDICELQWLCSHEISYQLCRTYGEIYPGLNPLAAILRDETRRLRTTQSEVAKKTGVSHIHYHKVVPGHEKIGLEMARRKFYFTIPGCVKPLAF